MAYILKKIGNRDNVPYHYYECDNQEDMNNISVENVPMGSVCYIISDDAAYTLNSSKEWKPRSISSGGDSGGEINVSSIIGGDANGNS